MVSESSIPQSTVITPNLEQEGGLQLGRFVAAIKRHALIVIGVTTLTTSVAVLKAITDTPVYEAGFELLTPSTTLETQIISTINDEALSNQSEVLKQAVDDTKLKILKSPRLMEPILAEVQARYPNAKYQQIARNLTITPDKSGNTLTVVYSSENPSMVPYVLEVVAEAYLVYSLENRQNAIFRGIDFVDEQLPIARQRVETLEAELEGLRQSENLIDPLFKGEQLSQQVAQFNAEQLELGVQIRQAQDLYANLRQELNESDEFAATSALSESGRYQALLDQLLAIDSELAEQLTLYLEDSPEIEVIEEQRQNLQPLLEREGIRVQQQLENYILELQDRDRALGDTIETLNQQIKGLSTTARSYNSIQRELDIASENLNQLLTKREALRIDAAQRQTPWEILSPPSSPTASSASARRNLVLGAFLGLLLGSGVALLVDRISGKIHTIEELKNATGIPILGVIPYEKLLDSRYSLTNAIPQLGQLGFDTNIFAPRASNSHSAYSNSLPFLEAFRVLGTNIQLNSPNKAIKSFAVSSAIPNMGKSTITFHLAYAMASAGRKVLMVDADLRRPTLHDLCGVPNQKGLSNYIAGEFDLEDAIVDLPLDSKLFLLPAGDIPPDPIKILTAQRMNDLFNFVNSRFDLIIFDTPPVLGLADALVLAANTQGVILTATLGEIKFSQMQTALDELGIAKVPVLGLAANSSENDNQTHYSYYHVSQRLEKELNMEFDAEQNGGSEKKPTWYEAPLDSLGKSLKNRR